ncbi:sugar phosphate isomerase/epimerase family protein [Geosporobacter ferrireducens]|uniref:AP endonuclease n=1 Tax=Geosporobacter ferrireducens TaxID=1424294 RepID=A0A1D8GNQ5_9FIRM|nr:sugar phosphate isomerase/epimerase [Geosporobacter ferrireducens]AOT72571.1 AP endonuclease [Geosporobacter ferrireducens]MTI54967.1 sugar phosphate isomerase/epimerase [Geosporobacter ferrireducens]
MSRPVTLCTGQFADLSFEEVCKIASEMGYDGLEIACWGDHMNVRRAVLDEAYCKERLDILKKYNLKCWAISGHLAGQCVGDAYAYDVRLDNFVPDELNGKPEAIGEWAIKEMEYTAQAAQNMGCYVVTGFMGSPIWKYWYSFPQTTEEMVEQGFDTIVKVWTPILDVFKACNVKFALEVHPTEIAFDYYTAEKLLEKFNLHPSLGFNFDPSHLLWQGVSPVIFLRDFKTHIYHVHMKDVAVRLDGKAGILGSHMSFGDLRRGWNFRSLGHGDVQFPEIIRELNAMNYKGPLSVEWEDSGLDRMFGAKEALEFVKKINFTSSNIAFDDAMRG